MTADDRAALERLFAQAKGMLAAGDARAALLLAQQASKHAPLDADCCNLVGVCAIALGDGAAAEMCWRQAIALNARTVEARINLARYCMESNRGAEAEPLLYQAMALAPGNAAAPLLLGHVLAARRDAQAAHHYRQALSIDASLAEAWANLALELEKQANWNDAEAHHRRALELAPASPQIHANLGNLMARTFRHDEAELEYQQALALDPASAIAHSNLGVLHADSGRDAEAEAALRRALQLNPGYQLARHNLAMLLLAQGRFEEGWTLHEARHHRDLPAPDAPLPTLPGKQWQGEPLRDKRLLIWPEQGYGDMIQFCRYVPLIKQQGAARIDLVCRKAQVSLLETLDGVDSVVALEDAAAILGSHDYWTLPMSLPLHCGTTLSTIPARLPYLHAPPNRRDSWRDRLSAPKGRKIGLVWRGNPMHANDEKRSLADFSIMQPLLAIESISLFSLQLSAQETVPAQVVDLGPGITDFADSAAIIAQLDLLITVDTAVAHLAGALGKPCWIMLPSHRPDWRWLRGRGDSPWYPDVVRLYRQAVGEEWHAVVARIVEDLQ